MNSTAILYHSPGCGSAAIKVALQVLNVPHSIIEFDWDEYKAGKYEGTDKLNEFRSYNSLTQFPTFITKEGVVITEIAAILFYLENVYAKGTTWDTSALSPAQKAAYYRWMCYIPANLYPLLTMLDFPERFIEVPDSAVCPPEAVHGWLKLKVSDRRADIFKALENSIAISSLREPGQYALGTATPTFLDLFLALVSHYTVHPRYEWINENCPHLVELVTQTVNLPGIREIFVEETLTAFVIPV